MHPAGNASHLTVLADWINAVSLDRNTRSAEPPSQLQWISNYVVRQQVTNRPAGKYDTVYARNIRYDEVFFELLYIQLYSPSQHGSITVINTKN